MSFTKKYKQALKKNKSFLCVGLDSDYERLPDCLKNEDNPMKKFNKEIIEATRDLVCAYKPNAAFYESAGKVGFQAWEVLNEQIGDEIPVIADVKRGDIGNTARHYAKSLFELNDFDAATSNPYMGWDAIEPFMKYDDRYLFVLAITSNSSAKDFEYYHDLYKLVSKKVSEWNEKVDNRLGLVTGATKPEELKEIRKICTDEILLIPGIGTQGGEVEKTIKYGYGGSNGNMVINVARSIIFASSGKDFAEKAREKAKYYKELFNNYL
ncbi:MAG: orotidine-5'-phosphate decarboxylase [Candidatus Mcinerneyibacterium aminivorans]|uniref:Orotidine-5'-phosphate decarboxylase n=1 Tax=Candidatus Mcinerneyibacterium aminivorans TaxID=2703815 RepID=A0A5D0MD44_9BACT|nr:MAG: orotidine-5'-phosphate decarboxylase [Candidatus Mcinerneyibacterium aminivorans]